LGKRTKSVRIAAKKPPIIIKKDGERRKRMFQVTETATAAIKEHFKDRETIPTIRIYLSQGG